MPSVRCPQCRAPQEVEEPLPGSLGRHSCTACGRTFAVRGPAVSPALAGDPAPQAASPGSTQKLSPAEPLPGDPLSAPPADAAGHPARLGPYEIRGVLGTGGMGVVYRGWDASLGRNVALKTLKGDLAQDPGYRERFLREARSAAALSHPNVTQIYFIGEEAGQPFFAMELLEGKSLEALVREKGKLPPQQAVELIRQAASGLKAAAARGIIHRDIKPSNLVLASDGTLKVTDFGLAKLVLSSDAHLTMVGEVLGSPNYMSPEQASGRPADLRSDIYALGATLHELVTGRPPFDGPTAVSILLKHAREPLRNPRQICPDLPYPLAALIQKMLAKRPEDRPQSYDLLLRDLERLEEMKGGAAASRPPVAARSSPDRSASPPTSSRSPGTWILVPVLVLVLLGGWGLLRHLRAAPASLESAEAPKDSALPAPSGTQVLSSTSEVSPPDLGSPPGRLRGLGVAPRLERMREMSRASLQFVSNTHEFAADGRLRVMGSVVNSGLGGAASVRVRIVLSGSGGQILGTAEVPLTPSFLPPHQTGSFEAFFPDPHQPITIRTELSWNS
jgi:serine/threonine protein kinase